MTEADQRRAERAPQHDAVKKRVRVGEVDTPTVWLPPRAKSLYGGLNTIAWQIETDLFSALNRHHLRGDDEGRTLITAALRSAVSLRVPETELVVTPAPQSSPHRPHAAAELCRIPEEAATHPPGACLSPVVPDRRRRPVTGTPRTENSDEG